MFKIGVGCIYYFLWSMSLKEGANNPIKVINEAFEKNIGVFLMKMLQNLCHLGLMVLMCFKGCAMGVTC